jgi:glycosyltransferase involved in cell wall biosynthesis
MKLSIIITTFKRSGHLNCHLQSLEIQDLPFDYEVIVVNDGPKDETEKVCDSFKNKLNIRYIFTGQRHYRKGKNWRVPGFAINIAAKKAKGEYIVITCAEMIPLEKDMLKLMVEELDKDPKLLVITDGRHDDKSKFKKLFERQSLNFDRNIYNDPTLSVLNTKYPFYMAMNKKDFIDIGGYDEDFTGNGFDDNDIVDRMILYGAKYKKIDRRVIHMFHKTEHSAKEWGFNKRLYNKRKGAIFRNKEKDWGKCEDQDVGKNIKMKIHIVTLKSGWILQKIAERIAKYNPYDEVKITIGHQPVRSCDVNFFIDLENCYNSKNKTNCDFVFFTHAKFNDIKLLKKTISNLDGPHLKGFISMNYRYTKILEGIGVSKNKIATITPGETKNMFPLRKIILGIVSRGDRKWYGKNFIKEWMSICDLSNFEIKILGSGWEDLLPLAESKNIDLSIIKDTEKSYDFYPSFYKSIDYLLIPCTYTAGPMSMQEALSTGIPVISADVGFTNYEFKADYVYPPGNVDELIKICKDIEEPRVNRRNQVCNMTWENYSKTIIDFIRDKKDIKI